MYRNPSSPFFKFENSNEDTDLSKMGRSDPMSKANAAAPVKLMHTRSSIDICKFLGRSNLQTQHQQQHLR